MVKENRRVWKAKYFERLSEQLNEFDKCFIVGVDNVRSNQMQKIRISLRGEGEVVMGKNTMMRKVINGQMEAKPSLEKLLPHIVQNVGLVFTKSELQNVRETIEANKVEAPAKAGQIAQCDVSIPKQNTGMGPEKTSFFQALQIQTKITRGTIEIINDVPLIKKGDKVGASEATLLGMLGIHPFSYGLVIKQVFDQGSVYSPEVLDITPADVLARFMQGVSNVASVSLAAGIPTAASVPHSLANAFRKCLAVSVATDYTFKEAEQVKEYLKDPSKFASAAPAAGGAVKGASAGGAAAETKAAEPEEEEEESDEDIGMGLFD